jgi:hypothetical protein
MQIKSWIEIVPPLPRLEAEKAFQVWKEKFETEKGILDQSSIRIDTMRDLNGKTIIRYQFSG